MHVVTSMRVVVLALTAVLGVCLGTLSAYAATHRPIVKQPSAYDVASTNVDLAHAKLVQGDIASAQSAVEVAKASTAVCDADVACKARVENFSLHARLEQVERRVTLWSSKK